MDEKQMTRRVEKILSETLREQKVQPKDAMVQIIAVIMRRHIECELRKGGQMPPWPGGTRLDALTAVMDSLHQATRRKKLDDPPEGEDGIFADAMFRMLTQCSIVAEEVIEQESRPKMRLVED